MQILFTTFLILMLTTCGYAVWAGGRDGRIACVMLFSAAVLTNFVTRGGSRVPLLIVDMLLLAGLIWLALKSRAHWPMWIAGFHIITVAEDMATLIVPGARYGVIHAVTGFWAIPMQIVMVLGIFLDRYHQRQMSRIRQ